MKIGRSLTELAAEIERQRESKRDILVDTRALTLDVDAKHLQIDDPGFGEPLGITDHAHGQVAEYTGIPKPYYDLMRAKAPALAARNVNHWLVEKHEPRMVRTLDGDMRAFMSNGYRALDNYDLLDAALPPMAEIGVEVVSCEVTATRLYLKVVDKRIMRDLPNGVILGQGHYRFDTASPAMVLSNSEVGAGALAVQSSVWTHGCTNLMVIGERSIRKHHVGTRHELGEDVFRMLSDQTRRLTDAALWAQIGDVVRGAFDEARFDAQIARIAETAENKIEADPVKVVEVTAKRYGLNDGERSSVLQHLIRGGSLTQYGLHAAVTRAAEDLDDYERASEFERLGGRIVELPKSEWRELAKAA